MSTFPANLNTILSATYGKDMRRAIHDALAQLSDSAGTVGTIKSALKCMHRDRTVTTNTLTVTDESTLLENPSYVTLRTTSFDTQLDGIFVWKNSNELIPTDAYTVTYDAEDDEYTVIFTSTGWFESGDRMDFIVYRGGGSLQNILDDHLAEFEGYKDTLEEHIEEFEAYKSTVDEQIAEALKNYTAATNTENAVETVTRTVAEGTLLADPENGPIGAYFAFISEEVFNPYKDGLQIWLNGTRFIPRDYYVIAYGGGVKVEMNGCTFYTSIMQAGSPERWYIYFDWERIQFSVGDRLEFIINHSPQAVSAITAGRAVIVSSGPSNSSAQGTSEEG